MARLLSMRGVAVDMAQLAAKNPNTPAVGNAKMNARGDIIGAGGTVIKKREDVAMEYHRSNPKAVSRVSLRDLAADAFQTPAEAIEALKKAQPTPTEPKAKPRKLIDGD